MKHCYSCGNIIAIGDSCAKYTLDDFDKEILDLSTRMCLFFHKDHFRGWIKIHLRRRCASRQAVKRLCGNS